MTDFGGYLKGFDY